MADSAGTKLPTWARRAIWIKFKFKIGKSKSRDDDREDVDAHQPDLLQVHALPAGVGSRQEHHLGPVVFVKSKLGVVWRDHPAGPAEPAAEPRGATGGGGGGGRQFQQRVAAAADVDGVAVAPRKDLERIS